LKEIYKFLTDRGKLLDSHRNELREKRGFGDKHVLEYRFFSGGSYLAEFESDMLKEFKEMDLLASSTFIFDPKQNRIVINPVLLNENNTVDGKSVSGIIIPYVNRNDEVYSIRPHKLWLKSVTAEIYQGANLKGDPEEIVITEGEFKAVAGCIFGIPTVAIPGIQTFSETKYPQLIDFLKIHGTKRIVIMFDNEVKNDPNIPSKFKTDPSKRYDTQFYAYYMASKLEQSGFGVRIATLPDSWREDGKIDIDGALQQGRLAGEVKRLVYDAVLRNDYLRELDTEAKQVVLRKRAQKTNRGNIKREFNRYVATRRGKAGAEWDETISDFVMKIVATHDTPDGIKREIMFVSEFGERSKTFSIGADAMSSSDKFRSFCFDKGNFTWRGNLNDLLTIWQSEFLMMDEGRYILESDHVGWIESMKIWLFGNVAIDREGKEIRPDADGIFWMDKKGVKVSALSITTGKSSIAEGVPYLNMSTKIDMNEVLKKLGDTIGKEEAAVALGWVSAVPFMEDVFAQYGSFPFLFVTGQMTSGKSTIAEWLMRFFGIDAGGKSMSQTTSVGIQRILAYYSAMPVYLDEYRNTKDIISKNGFLRNVYNRQSSGKGVKADFGIREAKVRGTVILAGEETPKDPALLSRFIPIFVSRPKRIENHYNWFQANKGKFSSHLYDLIKRRQALGPVFAEAFVKWQKSFISQGIEDRLAVNYATVAAGYTVAFGDTDLNFGGWLLKETQIVQSEQREERAIAVFFEDVISLKSRKLLEGSYWAISGNRAYIYFHGIHQIWSEKYRQARGEEAFKEQSIRAYLKEEPGYIEMNYLKKLNGEARRCVVFDLTKCSRDIQILVGANVVSDDEIEFFPGRQVHTSHREPGGEG